MPNDRFGCSVGLDQNLAIVGAYFNDELATSAGAAYLFDISTGQQLSKLLAKDEEENTIILAGFGDALPLAALTRSSELHAPMSSKMMKVQLTCLTSVTALP